MSRVLAIAGTDVRRFLRVRVTLAVSLLMPLVLILFVGLQFGSGAGAARLGVTGDVDSAFAGAVLAALDVRSGDVEVEVEIVDDATDLADRVAASALDGGVTFPSDADAELAAGRPVEVGLVSTNTPAAQGLSRAIDAAVAEVAAVPSAAAAVGADPAVAHELAGDVQPLAVEVVTAGERLFPEGLGQFDVAAPSQLVLFVFMTGLTGSAQLIAARQLGVVHRALSTPTAAWQIVTGQALGRFAIGAGQAVLIVAVTAIAFDMDWGDPLAAAALVVAVAATAAAMSMLLGSLFRNPQAADGFGTMLGLSFGALGGAMLPIELFSDTLASIARVTPHYWAIDGFALLVRHDGSLAGVAGNLAILAGITVGLLAAAGWRLRRVLTR